MSTSGIQNSNDTTAVLEMVLMSASFITHSFTQGLQLSILKTVNTRLIKVRTERKTLHRPQKISLQLLLQVLQWLHQRTYVTDVVSQHSEMGPSSPSLKSVPDRRQDEDTLTAPKH
jgi:hypothetical protein